MTRSDLRKCNKPLPGLLAFLAKKMDSVSLFSKVASNQSSSPNGNGSGAFYFPGFLVVTALAYAEIFYELVLKFNCSPRQEIKEDADSDSKPQRGHPDQHCRCNRLRISRTFPQQQSDHDCFSTT